MDKYNMKLIKIEKNTCKRKVEVVIFEPTLFKKPKFPFVLIKNKIK